MINDQKKSGLWPEKNKGKTIYHKWVKDSSSVISIFKLRDNSLPPPKKKKTLSDGAKSIRDKKPF